uniref:Secreted protein n=1 Tax=Parascaris univalens TaxID=6257 RepID=A0A914ZQN9_PARUN
VQHAGHSFCPPLNIVPASFVPLLVFRLRCCFMPSRSLWSFFIVSLQLSWMCHFPTSSVRRDAICSFLTVVRYRSVGCVHEVKRSALLFKLQRHTDMTVHC